MKNFYLLFTTCCLFIGLKGTGQTNNYFGTTGVLSNAVWSTNPAGPYTSALVITSGAILNFDNAGSATGATIATTAGINFSVPITWTAGGTIGAAGVNLPINVSAGIEQDFGSSQNFSTSATAAITKNGGGSLAMSGDTYSGGFTLNAGTLIARGINAMGNGVLNLNGGILASNAARDFSGKYTGINIGGNIQFGDVTGLANSGADLKFSNSMSLGGANPTLTLGNAGTTTFGGVISGSNGITFNNNINGTGLFDITGTANTFMGAVNINGGQTRFCSGCQFWCCSQ